VNSAVDNLSILVSGKRWQVHLPLHQLHATSFSRFFCSRFIDLLISLPLSFQLLIRLLIVDYLFALNSQFSRRRCWGASWHDAAVAPNIPSPWLPIGHTFGPTSVAFRADAIMEAPAEESVDRAGLFTLSSYSFVRNAGVVLRRAIDSPSLIMSEFEEATGLPPSNGINNTVTTTLSASSIVT
jgi:hypothetical protein